MEIWIKNDDKYDLAGDKKYVKKKKAPEMAT